MQYQIAFDQACQADWARLEGSSLHCSVFSDDAGTMASGAVLESCLELEEFLILTLSQL